jgi:hypothetical protein
MSKAQRGLKNMPHISNIVNCGKQNTKPLKYKRCEVQCLSLTMAINGSKVSIYNAKAWFRIVAVVAFFPI